MTNKKSVLLLSHFFYPHVGGIETVSKILAEQLVAKGFAVTVLTWSACHHADNFPFTVIRKPGIIKLLNSYRKAHVVLENNLCLRLSWPGFLIRKPNIIILQTWIDHLKTFRLSRMAKHRKLSLADNVVAISNAMKQKIWPAADIIHNPFNENIFKIKKGIERENNFVFAGRLVSDKGVDLAIKALRMVIDMSLVPEKPTLTIIGDGPELPKLYALTSQLGLQKAIRFKGKLDGQKLCEELNRHAFLVVPSKWDEPFGIVALEGMACGCVPLVSNSGGLPEAIGNAGITFTHNSVSSLSEKMIELLSNKMLYRDLQSNAAGHLNRFRSINIANQYCELLKQMELF